MEKLDILIKELELYQGGLIGNNTILQRLFVVRKEVELHFSLQGVMNPLPDLKSKSLNLFLDEYKNLASKDVLTKVWEYGNNQWENGYSQGKYNTDFD